MKFLLADTWKNSQKVNFNYFIQDLDNIDIPTKDDLVQVLEKYISEYTSIHLYVLISFFLITVVSQVFLAIFVAKKIEKFTNELKKTEVKFSRFNTLQIDALKIIYDKAVTFHYMNYKLFYHKTYSHETLKTKIANWKAEFVSIMDILHRERILLPNELESIVKEFENQIKKISVLLDIEIKSLVTIEKRYGTDDPQILYQNQENEVEAMKQIIEKLFDHEEIKNSETLIQSFKKKIEECFTNLGQ